MAMTSRLTWARARSAGAGVAIAALVAGCVAEQGVSSSGYGVAGSAPGSSAAGATGAAAGNAQPMLVVVDPDRTMNAAPGQGVGVFTEYQTGGHWHVWWTCDTAKTDLSCGFKVGVYIAAGTIANLAGDELGAGDEFSQPSPQEVQAVTTTTTSINGITFDTPPGSTITLDAQLDGQRDGSFLFFVQDGKVNGGYGMPVTDPLMLQAASP